MTSLSILFQNTVDRDPIERPPAPGCFVDLALDQIAAAITVFAKGMRAVREHLAQAAKISYRREKEHWFLDAVEIYCNALTQLIQDLSSAE